MSTEPAASVADEGAMYSRPAPKVLDIAERFERHDKSLILEDAEACISEMGRLAGPLGTPLALGDMVTGLVNFPELQEAEASHIADALWVLLTFIHGEPPKVWVNSANIFQHLDQADVREEMDNIWFRTVHASFAAYKPKYPFGKALPKQEPGRLAEQNRRASERERVVQQGLAAIAEITGPITRGLAAATANLGESITQLTEQHQKTFTDGTYPAPEPQPYGVSPRGAELWVADALRWLEAGDAEVTPQGGDGGVDVLTGRYAVSVKNYAGFVPVEEVREIYGVSTAMSLTPMLWTSGLLTKAGAQFAVTAEIAVFHYEVETAQIEALNGAAEELLEGGL